VASWKNQYLRKIIREIIDFIRLFIRIIAAYSQGSTEMTARFSPVSPSDLESKQPHRAADQTNFRARGKDLGISQ
jgi:hypothetical protein